MKILYITNGITGAGGLERVLSVKASLLAEALGHEVHILSLNEKNAAPFFSFSDKIIRHSVAVGGNLVKYFTQYFKGIRNKVTEIKPDIISVCDDGLKGFFLPRLLRLRVPIIYERHVSKDIMLNSSKGFGRFLFRCQSHLMNLLSNDFDAFVILTEGNTCEWPFSRNLKVIPNPLSFGLSRSSTLQNKKVIAVGKQSYQKSYDRLLKIWGIATNSQPEWQLHIYGTKTESERLPELAHALGISHSVFFHDPDPAIEGKFLDSSIFVLSSRYEGFGMVIIEAMSCGLPVVSFDCPHGPADIITDEKDGFLIENGNINEFAEKLQRLMQDADLRMKMGELAQITSRKYDASVIVRQWDALFKTLITDKPAIR